MVSGSPKREKPDPSRHYDTTELLAMTWLHERGPSTSQPTESGDRAGEPRSQLAVRLLATGALLVGALIHAQLAFRLGVGGLPFGRGQLSFLNALAGAIIALAMFTRSSRVWIFAFVFSGAGMLGILAGAYFPVASVGPFPAIDDPTWSLTKAVCAVTEVTVIALWLIRRKIAPARRPE
jgi:hypothetical protein